MSESKTKKLKDLISFQRKGITPSYTEQREQNLYVLNQKCNRDYKLNLNLGSYHDLEKKKVAPDLILRAGDVLVNSTGKGTLGRVAQFNGYHKPITIDSHLLLMRAKDQLDPYYFGYAIKCYQDVLQNKGIGSSGQEELDKISLNEISITYPVNKEEQNKIATILKILDEKIEVNNRLNHNLEAMAQALYDYWFVQFDFPDENGKPYKSSGGKMVWNEHLKREIPKGWLTEKFEAHASIVMGTSPKGESLNTNGNGAIFYQGCTDFEAIFPSVRVFTTQPKRMAKANDILFSVRAPVGSMNIADKDCCIGRGLAAIRSKLGAPAYLWYELLSLKRHYCKFNKEGSIFGAINKDELHDIPVITSPKIIVDRFEKSIGNMYLARISRDRENIMLTAQRDFLLPLLMNGQVKVIPQE